MLQDNYTNKGQFSALNFDYAYMQYLFSSQYLMPRLCFDQ